jgi:hypothetical protein
MKRIIAIAAGIAALALGGTTALAGGPVDGTSAGRDIGAPNASATCNLASPTKPSDYLCRFAIHGSYFDDNPILGDGTYTGTITQVWSNQGTNTNYSNEPCILVTGTITYKRTGKSGSLTTTLVANPTPFDPANGLYSMACWSGSGPEAGSGDFHYMEQVTGATGYFHTAVKHPTTSNITANGNSYPSGGSAQNELVNAYLGVNLS